MSAPDQQLSAETVAAFGCGWEPDSEAKRLVAEYLSHIPDQGDWDWNDYCDGLAGGILNVLHEYGFRLDRWSNWRQLRAYHGLIHSDGTVNEKGAP